MHPADQLDRSVRALKTAANHLRLRILETVAANPGCAGDFVALRHTLSPTHAAVELANLREAGLIEQRRKDGHGGYAPTPVGEAVLAVHSAIAPAPAPPPPAFSFFPTETRS